MKKISKDMTCAIITAIGVTLTGVKFAGILAALGALADPRYTDLILCVPALLLTFVPGVGVGFAVVGYHLVWDWSLALSLATAVAHLGCVVAVLFCKCWEEPSLETRPVPI